ncbi:copper transporter [Aeromicrobium wangtongii]|uniref:copper transporter n=1 Tax=Aeromicrobium wangtongii TaxID=2969247 RepID=UPI0020171AC4|nr:copper transporter [Aeromicrobium wangtongii]MCL3818644.1 copper transporter [Aeromicrobium wangtongii]
MITFRYHLVSIAAVLIALAAGIALGSGPLDEATDVLGGGNSSKADPAKVSFEDGFAGRTAEGLLEDQLKGQSVLVLTVPGASQGEVTGIVDNLKLAGAEVTGQVELTSKLLDSAGRQFAEGVATQSAADVPGVSAATDSYGRIGAALARALMADETTPADQTAMTVRSAFSEGDLIAAATPPANLATMAVLVTGPERAGTADRSTVIAALAGALNDTGKGVLVAGPASSSTDGGAVKAVRDGAFATAVSTVDVTDTASGRIVTVLAAAAQASGQPGAWGTSRSTGGAMPQ